MGGYGASTCYALSEDGVRWTKPALGVRKGTKEVRGAPAPGRSLPGDGLGPGRVRRPPGVGGAGGRRGRRGGARARPALGPLRRLVGPPPDAGRDEPRR